jgi:hypothetical protein
MDNPCACPNLIAQSSWLSSMQGVLWMNVDPALTLAEHVCRTTFADILCIVPPLCYAFVLQ